VFIIKPFLNPRLSVYDERQKREHEKYVQSPDFTEFTKYKPSMIHFYNQERVAVLKELSLFAINKDGYAVCLGNEVKLIDERESAELHIGSPLKNGVIADFRLSVQLFKYFFLRAGALNNILNLFRPSVAICIPIKMTYVEQRAMIQLMQMIGIKNFLIIEKSYQNATWQMSEYYKFVVEIIPEIE